MSSKYVSAALLSLLILAACGNKVDETVVGNIQDLSEKAETGKTEMAPLAEKTQALASKLQMVPSDLQAKEEFTDFYKIARAVTIKKEMMEASYTELQSQLSEIEENYRSGKVKKEALTAELDNINEQLESIRNSVPVVMHITDSLSSAYDQMAAGATGVPQPVALPDAMGMPAPTAGAGALAAPAPGAAAVAPQSDAATAPGAGAAPAADDSKKRQAEKDAMMKSGKKSNPGFINQ